jgi:hypothetical protein
VSLSTTAERRDTHDSDDDGVDAAIASFPRREPDTA